MENNIEKTAEIINEKLANKVDRNEVDALKLQVKDLESAAEALTAKMQGLTGVENKKESKMSLIDAVKSNPNLAEFLKGDKEGLKLKGTFTPASVINYTNEMLLPEVGRPQIAETWFAKIFRRARIINGADGTVKFRDWDIPNIVVAANDMANFGPNNNESTFSMEQFSINIKPIADKIKISMFALTDVNVGMGAEAEVRQFLMDNMVKLENQRMFDGDSATPNQFSGLYKLSPLFPYAGWAGDKFASPGYATVVNVIKGTMKNNKSNQFIPDYLLINPLDETALYEEEDANGIKYNQGKTLEQIFNLRVVISTPYVPKNQLIIGDSTKPLIIDDGDFMYEIMRDSDISTFELILQVYKRECLLIRGIYLGSSYKVDSISAMKTALTV